MASEQIVGRTSDVFPPPQAMQTGEPGETRSLLRWTIGAVCASWVLNLLTFWVAMQQHQDAKELLDVQVANSKELLRVQVGNAKELLQVQTSLARDQLHVQSGIDLDNEFNSSEMQLRRNRFASGLYRALSLRDSNKVRSIYDLKNENVDALLNNFQVLDFFNKVGLYVKDGRLDEEDAYVEFYRQVVNYWPLSKEVVARQRSASRNSNLYSGFEDLYQRMVQEEARHHGGQTPPPPGPEQLRAFLTEEVRLEAQGEEEQEAAQAKEQHEANVRFQEEQQRQFMQHH
jgi:hypothetical protein